MLLYLDACCLNRPFDDQRQLRIHLESEAVLALLDEVYYGKYQLADSAVLQFEIGRIADPTRRQGVRQFLAYAKTHQPLSPTVQARAAVLCSLGFKQMDALHLASAEELKAVHFLSTDDRLVTRAATHAQLLKVLVANPLNFPNL